MKIKSFGIVVGQLAFTLNLAMAHPTRHGEKILGFGPHQGKLVPIIRSVDAEKKQGVQTIAVAEWVRQGQELQVHFWDKSLKKSLLLPYPSELKWIILNKNSGHQVVPNKLESAQASISYSLDEKKLKEIKMVEIILPGLGPLNEKLVLLIDLHQ